MSRYPSPRRGESVDAYRARYAMETGSPPTDQFIQDLAKSLAPRGPGWRALPASMAAGPAPTDGGLLEAAETARREAAATTDEPGGQATAPEQPVPLSEPATEPSAAPPSQPTTAGPLPGRLIIAPPGSGKTFAVRALLDKDPSAAVFDGDEIIRHAAAAPPPRWRARPELASAEAARQWAIIAAFLGSRPDATVVHGADVTAAPNVVHTAAVIPDSLEELHAKDAQRGAGSSGLSLDDLRAELEIARRLATTRGWKTYPSVTKALSATEPDVPEASSHASPGQAAEGADVAGPDTSDTGVDIITPTGETIRVHKKKGETADEAVARVTSDHPGSKRA